MPECDLCKKDFIDKEAVVDSKTIWGFWAFLCEDHYKMVGSKQYFTDLRKKEHEST